MLGPLSICRVARFLIHVRAYLQIRLLLTCTQTIKIIYRYVYTTIAYKYCLQMQILSKDTSILRRARTPLHLLRREVLDTCPSACATTSIAYICTNRDTAYHYCLQIHMLFTTINRYIDPEAS